MSSFNLNIVTPIRELKLGTVSYARCPGIDGQFGIMNNHREGIFALSIGELKITQNGENEYFATGGGFAEIINNSVKLLVESIESSKEININPRSRISKKSKEQKNKR